MRILHYVHRRGDSRHFEPFFRLLVERGDQVRVLFSDGGPMPDGSALEILAREYGDRLTYAKGPSPTTAGRLRILGRRLRAAVNYLASLGPEFRGATKFRHRMEKNAPRIVVRLTRGTPFGGERATRSLTKLLRAMEHRLPVDPAVEELLHRWGPDVVLVTPFFGDSPETEYVRAAKRLGIRSGICIASWDNLTTKGLIHALPDFLTVWNEAQRREAREIHGVPEERVLVTGAQSFDHWFEWRPTSRDEFCRRVGLDPGLPYLLYLGSSPNITDGREPAYVEGWFTSLKARPEPELARLQALVRPHPVAVDRWPAQELRRIPGIAVWPLLRAKLSDPAMRQDFYDSIHHSAAVIGINTSALIESAIIGRPVYTLLAPEFRDAQEGTLHFSLISEFGGGILTIARDFEEHARQLSEVLTEPEAVAKREEPRRRRFLEAFVRPHGLDRPAAPILVEAMDRAVLAGRQKAA